MRPQRMLQRKEFCSQVPRHLTQKQTPKKVNKQTFSASDDTHIRPIHNRGRQTPVSSTHSAWHIKVGAWHPNTHSHAPGAWSQASGVCSLRPKALFCDFLVKKAWDFSPSSGENCPYKYRILHLQFLIQNEAVQDEGKHWSFQGGVSLLTSSFSRVCFISFVICLQLP